MRPVFDRSVAEINGIVVSLPMNWALYICVWVCMSEWFCVCVCVNASPLHLNMTPFSVAIINSKTKAFDWLLSDSYMSSVISEQAIARWLIIFMPTNESEGCCRASVVLRLVWCLCPSGKFLRKHRFIHIWYCHACCEGERKRILWCFFLMCNKKLCSYTCISFALIWVSVGKLLALCPQFSLFFHTERTSTYFWWRSRSDLYLFILP